MEVTIVDRLLACFSSCFSRQPLPVVAAPNQPREEDLLSHRDLIGLLWNGSSDQKVDTCSMGLLQANRAYVSCPSNLLIMQMPFPVLSQAWAAQRVTREAGAANPEVAAMQRQELLQLDVLQPLLAMLRHTSARLRAAAAQVSAVSACMGYSVGRAPNDKLLLAAFSLLTAHQSALPMQMQHISMYITGKFAAAVKYLILTPTCRHCATWRWRQQQALQRRCPPVRHPQPQAQPGTSSTRTCPASSPACRGSAAAKSCCCAHSHLPCSPRDA